MATKPRFKRVEKVEEPAEEMENVDVSPVPSRGPPKMCTTALSLQEELDVMTSTLMQVSLEKEQNEAKLREKDEQLSAQVAEAERIQNLLKSSDEEKKRLEEKIRKLQKVQGFQPTLNISMSAPISPKDLAKKKKDPNRLKKPNSSFLLWCKDHRQTVCEENPNATFAEISAIMGDKWKNVSEDDRKPYEDRYRVEKEIYLKLVGQEKRETEALKLFHEEQNKKQAQELLEQYLAYKKEAEMDNGKKKKKQKDPLKPKYPISAFFAFSQSRRPALLEEKKPLTEISKILGEEWKTLSPVKRATFDEIAVKDKERYFIELEAYKKNRAQDLSIAEREAEKKSMIEKAQALELYKQKEKLDQAKKAMKERVKGKKDLAKEMKDQAKEKKSANQEKKAVTQEKKDHAKEKKAKDPNKPKKPLTSYLIFSQEIRKALINEQAGLNFVDTNAHISQKWKELSQKDKEIWNEKAALLKKKYEMDMEKYRKTNPEPAVETVSTPNGSMTEPAIPGKGPLVLVYDPLGWKFASVSSSSKLQERFFSQ